MFYVWKTYHRNELNLCLVRHHFPMLLKPYKTTKHTTINDPMKTQIKIHSKSLLRRKIYAFVTLYVPLWHYMFSMLYVPMSIYVIQSVGKHILPSLNRKRNPIDILFSHDSISKSKLDIHTVELDLKVKLFMLLLCESQKADKWVIHNVYSIWLNEGCRWISPDIDDKPMKGKDLFVILYMLSKISTVFLLFICPFLLGNLYNLNFVEDEGVDFLSFMFILVHWLKLCIYVPIIRIFSIWLIFSHT